MDSYKENLIKKYATAKNQFNLHPTPTEGGVLDLYMEPKCFRRRVRQYKVFNQRGFGRNL